MTRREEAETPARGTTEEWIKRAHEGGEPASCLARAEGAARGADDWNALAVAWVELADAVSARRCVETALECARGEHWPSRQAAEFLVTRLGEREAASAALGRIEARLQSPGKDAPPRAYQWVMLARAYREVLDQTDAVHRCLASAAAGAVEPDDLTNVARGSASLGGGVDETRGLLERAERLALERGEPYALRAVAERWMEDLHDAARARTLLERATAEVSALSELTRLASDCWWMFHDAEAMRRALARGETLATSPMDWVLLAESYCDGGQDSSEDPWEPAAVRRCLQAALTTQPPPTRAQRERIAVVFRDGLGESARAEEIAPPRRSMEEMVQPLRRLEEWPARDSQALLDRLRERISSEDLAVIAKADYGYNWESYHRALLEIKATGIFLLPLDVYPLEVLALSRWSRGEDTSHLRRAFACTVLGLDAILPDSHQVGSLSDVLAPLMESTWALGLDDELELLLVWWVEVVGWEHELAWALFALALSLARRAPADPRLGVLAARLEALETPEEDLRALLDWGRGVGFSDLWRTLTTELFDPKRGVPPSLERLARHLPEPEAPASS